MILDIYWLTKYTCICFNTFYLRIQSVFIDNKNTELIWGEVVGSYHDFSASADTSIAPREEPRPNIS